MSHMLRRFKALAESKDPEERRCGRRLLSAFSKICSLENTNPGPVQISNLRMRLKRLVTDFDESKRVGRFVRRLLQEFDALIFFLEHPEVEKTNNHAERMLRPAVCDRKVSFGSTSRKGEVWKARSLTVCSTCDLNKMSYYDVLVDALSSQARKVPPNLDQLRTICEEVAAEAKNHVA